MKQFIFLIMAEHRICISTELQRVHLCIYIVKTLHLKKILRYNVQCSDTYCNVCGE